MNNFVELLKQTQNKIEYDGLYQMILMAIVLRQQILISR